MFNIPMAHTSDQFICPICETAIVTNPSHDALTDTTSYDCERCGNYRLRELLLTRLSQEQHWPETRAGLMLALSKPGLVRKRHLETEQDVLDAIIDLSRPLDEGDSE